MAIQPALLTSTAQHNHSLHAAPLHAVCAGQGLSRLGHLSLNRRLSDSARSAASTLSTNTWSGAADQLAHLQKESSHRQHTHQTCQQVSTASCCYLWVPAAVQDILWVQAGSSGAHPSAAVGIILPSLTAGRGLIPCEVDHHCSTRVGPQSAYCPRQVPLWAASRFTRQQVKPANQLVPVLACTIPLPTSGAM